MSRSPLFLGAGVFAAALLATGASAHAALLFSNPGTASPCGAGCWASGGSAEYAFRTWDDFSIAADATITSVTWRGVAYDAEADLPTLDTLSWDIGFFSDDAGTPGPVVHSVTLADAEVDRVFLGTGSVGGRQVNAWEFSASLPVGFAVTGGTSYWFSPFSHQPDYFPVFAWSGSSGGVSFQELLTDGSTFVRTNNRAFTLSGSVPEPGAWALMILGFGAAGTVLRSRRTRIPRFN